VPSDLFTMRRKRPAPWRLGDLDCCCRAGALQEATVVRPLSEIGAGRAYPFMAERVQGKGSWTQEGREGRLCAEVGWQDGGSDCVVLLWRLQRHCSGWEPWCCPIDAARCATC